MTSISSATRSSEPSRGECAFCSKLAHVTNMNDVENRVVDTCLARDAQAAKVLVAARENPGQITVK